MSLHLVCSPGGRVIPLPARTSGGIGEEAASLGLIRMVRSITDPDDRAGLVLTHVEREDICAGLAVGATVRQRELALQRVAENHATWTATPQGVIEVIALRWHLAPNCGNKDWAELVNQAERADDAPTPSLRAAAEQALFEHLSAAVNPHPTVVRLWSQRSRSHRHDDGPGVA